MAKLEKAYKITKTQKTLYSQMGKSHMNDKYGHVSYNRVVTGVDKKALLAQSMEQCKMQIMDYITKSINQSWKSIHIFSKKSVHEKLSNNFNRS
jgi:hypothetical protein